MRLVDLQPKLLRQEGPTTLHHVDRIEDCDGIRFLCPCCFERNGGPNGTHSVVVFKVGSKYSELAHWVFEGGGIEDLTIKPSISLVQSKLPGGGLVGCGWHGFVTDGGIVSC